MGLIFGDDRWEIFYRTPDGEDVIYKAWHGAKLGFFTAIFPATLIVLGSSKNPVPMRKALVGYANWLIPGAGVGIVGSTAAQLSGRLRGKNDELNHFIAGVAGASVVGAKTHSFKVAGALSLMFGVYAALIKNFKLNGVSMKQKPRIRFTPMFYNHEKNSVWYNRKDMGPLE